ncbi:MAG: tRNA uridine-5-carboxymethylaminomethyl(34) synthesis GTPase MnmE [Nitrospirae bacterium]|nr:tRNA uridine-5-carboxymethylaminomethyl(34) synthesis GTPase MnmE [Candidatus Manganitrophaceae bacterium]
MKNRAAENDTICAIATPPGVGGVGIVRISGQAAGQIAASLYRGTPSWDNLKSHTATFAEVVDPKNSTLIDEALFLPMFAPHSYTGEDVVEIQAHGNPLILKKILSAAILQGARLASPGEFTRRAFMSGRIDLAQAEAVMELVAAKSDIQHQWALGQLKGQLSAKISILKKKLLDVLAEIEASIDFSEEELPLNSREEIASSIRDILSPMRALLAGYEVGRQIREGFTVVIMGRANVGKSSLMNHFLQEDRAIVTPIAGTTRDLLQEPLDLAGLSIKLVDTAGYRESVHPVEQEGVARAERIQRQADLVLWILDSSQALTEDDLYLAKMLQGRPLIIVLNKRDLPSLIDEGVLRLKYPNTEFMYISIKSDMGLKSLSNCIKSRLIVSPEKEPPMLALLRHRNALVVAESALSAALVSVQGGLSWEFPAIDLRDSLDALGEIVGETTVDTLLNEIFGQFCIGK